MKVTYLMNEFPILTENFIIYEIQGLLKRKVDVKVLSLAEPQTDRLSEIPKKFGFEHIIRYAKNYSNEKSHLFLTIFWLLRLVLKGRLSSVTKLFKDKSQFGIYPRFHLLRIAYQLETCHPQSDILFCHFGPLGNLGASLKYYGLIKHKLVTSFHGYDMSRTLQSEGNQVYDLLFSQAEKLIFVSQYFCGKAIALGCAKDKTAVVHTAIDCELFEFSPRSYPNNQTFNFITVGRLTAKKDHASLIEVFAQLIQANPNLTLNLKVVGSGPDYQALDTLIQALGVTSRVKLMGALQHQQVRENLKQSDIFVLNCVTAPDGDEEGIPGSIMEALALGLPVVSTSHTGVPELVTHMQSGLIATEYNKEALLKMLQKIIDQSELWPTFTKNGRQKVETEFERNNESDKLLNLLTTL